MTKKRLLHLNFLHFFQTLQKWAKASITPLEVNGKLYDKTQKGEKNEAMDFITMAAAQGLPEINGNNGNGKRSISGWFMDKTIGKWTAQGINDFQKTLFPFMFLTFAFLFSICSYLKIGDIAPEDFDD